MIVVRVERHSGITGEVKELARMHITNVGGDKHLANYRIETLHARSLKSLDKRKVTRTGPIFGHARRLHIWVLVAKAIAAVGY